MELIQVAPSGGQICNYCMWRHMVVKFATDASGAILCSNLQLMQMVSCDCQIKSKSRSQFLGPLCLWQCLYKSPNIKTCSSHYSENIATSIRAMMTLKRTPANNIFCANHFFPSHVCEGLRLEVCPTPAPKIATFTFIGGGKWANSIREPQMGNLVR